MSLTLHIVRKDLVRLRGWITCWVAVLLVPIAIGAWLLGHSPFASSHWDLPEKIAILAGVEVFVGYLLTILIIQEDSVVGTQAFWLTRPISRARLLGAKAISVVVIVGFVPIAVSLPWWLWCGFGPGQIASAAAEMLIILMIAIVPAAVVAVLADSFARAVLWSVALGAVAVFASFLLTAALTSSLRGNANAAVFVTRAEISIAAVTLEMLAVVIGQYLLRRRGWWLGCAGAVVILTVVAVTRWFAPSPSFEPHEHHAERAAGVKVQFHRAVSDPVPRKMSGELQLQRVASQLIVSGVPDDTILDGAIAKQRWAWAGGTTIRRDESFYSELSVDSMLGLQVGPEDAESKRTLVQQLEWRAKHDFAPGESFTEVSAWLPPSVVARMRAEPPKFQARLWWRVMRPELRLEIPLAPGPWSARHGHGVGIERIQRQDDVLTITLVATRPFLLAPALRSATEPFRRYNADNQQSWTLLDRERGRVVYTFNEANADKPRAVIVHGVKIEWRVHTTLGPGVFRNGKWTRDPEWRTGSSLGVMTLREEALFSREIGTERFAPAN